MAYQSSNLISRLHSFSRQFPFPALLSLLKTKPTGLCLDSSFPLYLGLDISERPATSTCIVFMASSSAKSILGHIIIKYVTISSGERRGSRSNFFPLCRYLSLKTKNVIIPPPPKNCCCFSCRQVYAEHPSKMDA